MGLYGKPAAERSERRPLAAPKTLPWMLARRRGAPKTVRLAQAYLSR